MAAVGTISWKGAINKPKHVKGQGATRADFDLLRTKGMVAQKQLEGSRSWEPLYQESQRACFYGEVLAERLISREIMHLGGLFSRRSKSGG